ncbi:uncharacterized protein KGF55_004983 [Candida pseudojiufengensis]|uniref:uncharacterized protein n=1 Tax=Candida pseudojiufengensis TaxID=497109 RepID=UPI002225A011|nr:uncharacterized protein KGF55_004983 [Candida pseudojiufengensis]KAI5959751.1 hypothetical protein KGF55_004983 [Candida pseudojiufengensis]
MLHLVSEIRSYTLNQLDLLENDSVFEVFNTEIAWELGQYGRKRCIKEFPRRNIVVDIALVGGHTLFHTAIGNDTNYDNDQWIKRKSNTVFRFGRSSFYMGQKLRIKNMSIEEALFVSPNEFATHGGSIPIKVASCSSLIGAFTISGLAQEEDHLLALDIVQTFLKSKVI